MRLPNVLLVSALVLRAQTFSVKVTENVKVPMRDGVELAADLYLPDAPGKYPTVVYRTPYNKAGQKSAGQFFAARGYAVVAQDVRGRFASGGDFYAFVNEGPDGYDTIEWAAKQPWSDGNVVTDGASYLAWDQYHAAMYRPPHLKAMFANVGGNNFYDEFAYPGGVLNPGWAIWIVKSAQTSNYPAPKDELNAVLRDPMNWLRSSISERGKVFEGFPAHHKMYYDFNAHPTFDGLWRQKGFYTQGGWKEMKDVPTFFISGWYDYFVEGAIENFTAMRHQQQSIQMLWLGPWPHGIGGAACGEVNFGVSAALDPKEIAFEFFNLSLKRAKPSRIVSRRGGSTGTVGIVMPIRYFRMGGGDGSTDQQGRRNHGGQWVDAMAWPPFGTTTESWYLDATGALVRSRPEKEGELSWRHDPANPVPTRGGRYNMVPNLPPCAQDQRPLDGRKDVLQFVSQNLMEPVEVTGRLTAKLVVSSDAPEADFMAKLVDVYPDGFAMTILDGVRRVKFDQKGQTKTAVIDLGTTSNLFAKGHRIRLDVASSNWPRVEVNPTAATNKVHLGGLRSSELVLSITQKPPAR
ncbi:MAG: CocE/NonD family hydrolase [Bryobacterales bacterium]|nr:CocE/NonD family hydrolase [Bryobacterales bacterium]